MDIKNHRRRLGVPSMLMASVSAILGSGWLFSAAYTSEAAGPAALLSWFIGAAFIIIVALCYAEICTLIPVTGSSARIPHYTHGTLVSFAFAWVNWLTYIGLMAIEVVGALSYISYYFPSLMTSSRHFTHTGFAVACLVLFILSIINTYSIRWLVAFNNVLTLFKLAIPIGIGLIIIGLLMGPSHHHFDLFHPAHSVFAPYHWHGILGAITTGGIVFSFNGFKQAAEMAGETHNPKKSIPIALVGSVGICLIVFLILQIAFLGSIHPENILHGWHHLNLSDNNSPFASILKQDGLSHFVPLVYLGAVISPLAAALIYCASASRSLYGLAKNEEIPKIFKWLSPHNAPIPAIIINFFLGLILFLPLPGWGAMMKFLSAVLSLTYIVGPINLLALRYQLPKAKRPFKLPCITVFAYIGFYICTLLAYWSGWSTIYKMIISILLGFIVLLIYRYCKPKSKRLKFYFKESLWLWVYFAGLSLISANGPYGGNHILSDLLAYLSIALLCLITLFLAIRFKIPGETVRRTLKLKEGINV